MTERASDCPHTHFDATIGVHRLTDDAGVVRNFVAEVEVRCTDCGSPFHFIGASSGYSFARPTVNVGATTLHAPIAPGQAPLPASIEFEIPRTRNFE